MDNSQKCTGGQWNFFASEITIFPGNMQQWQVNQREHLFTSQGRERELDGLLSMQTQAAQGNIYSFRPGWGPVPEGGPVPCVESSCAHMHALAKQTETLSIDELLHALPWCKANNCDYCMCPALDVSKHITSRVTFPGHDTIKWLKIYRQKKKTGLNGQDGGFTRV